MEPEQFREWLDTLSKVLDSQDPDLARTDWAGHARELDSMHEAAIWLLDHLESLPSICETEEVARDLTVHVLDSCAGAAVRLHAAMRTREARALLERCAGLGVELGESSLYQAGLEQLDALTRVYRARWLFAHEQHDAARTLAASLEGAAPPIAALAKRIADLPTPISSAPGLFTLNGFGVKIYGARDHRDDGSYVTTRFLTALFIPILPIDAYKVTAAGDEGYYFHGKVKLGRAMRIWQLAALALVVLAIAWASISSYLDSPERQLRLALDEAHEMESAEPEAALVVYEQLAVEYNHVEDDEDLLPLAEAWVRLASRELPDPMSAEGADQVAAIHARFSGLPGRMQEGELAQPFALALIEWAEEIGHETPAEADAALDLLTVAEGYAEGSNKARARDDLRTTRLALAEQLAVSWPLEALRQYVSFGEDEEALGAAAGILDALPESPTLFADIAPEVDQFARHAGPARASTRDRAVALVERGRELAAHEERQALLESGDQAALRAAFEADPTDQVLAVVLADQLRGAGQLDEAAELLSGLGTPGLMTHEAQYLLASIESERGRVDEAATMLSAMLSNRLPAFEEARRAYDKEFKALEDRLIRQAEQGNIPAAYKPAMTGEDVEAARAAFGQWLDASIADSIELTRLREAYTRQSDIVPVAVLLGNVQLQRARTTSGDEREALLDSAERTFLAIRGEARGMPSYHFSLGQVYHRLGRGTRGDAEFDVLLEDPDPMVRLLAAHGYRELGNFERAREIAEQIYEEAPSPGKEQAAKFRALLGFDLDERETWFERADQDEDFVRISLVELAGDRLRLEGKFEAADRKYAEVVDFYLESAEHDGSAANNAALTLGSRHACTGDRSHVEAAIELLRRSLAMRPDDTITLMNYARTLDLQAHLQLLDGFLPTEGLRVSGGEVMSLTGELYASSQREALIEAVRESGLRRKAMEAYAQIETLAPSRATPYEGQIAWLTFADNAEGVAKVVERLRAVEHLDLSDRLRAYEEQQSGASDERERQRLDAAIEGRAAVRKRDKRASAAVRGALFHLDGLDYGRRARVQPTPEEALADRRAAVEAFERAQQLWPEGLSSGSLADALISLAIAELAVEDPEFGQRWQAARKGGTKLMLWDLLEADSPLVAKLVSTSQLTRAAELVRALPDDQLGLRGLVLARMIGDGELEARSRASFDGELMVLLEEFGVLVEPYDEHVRRAHEIVVGLRAP